MKDVTGLEGAGGGDRAPRRWTVPAMVVATVTAVLGCGAALHVHAASQVNEVALSSRPKPVAVVKARGAGYVDTRRTVGTLEPWLAARIGPQHASGFVDTVLVRPGAKVKRGDVLATLDCRKASAETRIVSYQARALAERQKATSSEAARMRELLAGGYASPNEVEQKQAQAAASEAQIQALLAQASAQSITIDDCVLKAPFDGEVAARYVDPGAFARPGTALVEIIDRSIVRLVGHVPEVDLDAYAPETSARIHLLATGKDLTGVIARRAPAADPGTRTVQFEIDLPNEDVGIPVGTTAQVVVDHGAPVPAVEVPLLAARVRGDRATLFVVEGETARRREVKVVGERGGSLFVDGLDEAALVVTDGRARLRDEDLVVAKLESTPEPSPEQSPAPAPSGDGVVRAVHAPAAEDAGR